MDVERLVETWRGPLTGLLAGWGAAWTDAAELAQDALVEAYLGRNRFRGDLRDPAAAGPWLAAIARNLLRSRRRAHRRRREERLAGEPPVRPDGEEDARLEPLRSAMQRLPEPLRAVLYMHYLEQTSVREVAGLLGVTPKTVESRLFEARRTLRARLSQAAEERT